VIGNYVREQRHRRKLDLSAAVAARQPEAVAAAEGVKRMAAVRLLQAVLRRHKAQDEFCIKRKMTKSLNTWSAVSQVTLSPTVDSRKHQPY
jgi:hypothetical protein